MATQFDFLLSSVRAAGVTLSGGKVHFYEPGTTVDKDVFLDRVGLTVAANPYLLDANGTAQLYGGGLYRVVVKSANGATVYDREVSLSGIGAVQIINLNGAAAGDLAQTVADVGEGLATLAIASACEVAEDLTIPANISLRVLNGGAVNVPEGKTLTILGGLDADNYQIFTGGGLVKGMKKVKPEWWGAKADDATDCYPALVAMAKSVTATGSGEVVFSPGRYLIPRYKTQTPYELDSDPGITNPDIRYSNCNGLYIHGVGTTISVLGDYYRSADTQLGSNWYSHKRSIIPFVLDNCTNVVYDSVNVDGNIHQTTRDPRVLEGAAYGLLINAGSNFDIRNSVFSRIQTDGVLVGGYYLVDGKLIAAKHGTISNVTCEYCGRVALSIIAARDWVLSNCYFNKTGRAEGDYGYHSPGNGIDIEADYNISSVPYPADVNTGNITFINCSAVDNIGSQFTAAYAESTDNVLLKNFTMVQGADGTSSPYVAIVSINGIVIEDSTIHAGDGYISAGFGSQTVYQHVVIRNCTIYGHGLTLVSPLEGDVKILHNRIIGQHTAPLSGGYFPYIINSKAIFKDNYIFLPAAAYNAVSGVFLSSYVSAKQVSGNVYDSDIDGSTGNYFSVLYSPTGDVVNETFLNKESFRPNGNTTYDGLPFNQSSAATGDALVLGQFDLQGNHCKVIYATANPTTGTWNVGDRWIMAAPAVGLTKGKFCTVAGTAGTLTGVTGSINSGSKILTVNNAANLAAGQIISIAGVGVRTIKSVVGTTVTLLTTAGATVVAAAVTYSAPTWVSEGNL